MVGNYGGRKRVLGSERWERVVGSEAWGRVVGNEGEREC